MWSCIPSLRLITAGIYVAAPPGYVFFLLARDAGLGSVSPSTRPGQCVHLP